MPGWPRSRQVSPASYLACEGAGVIFPHSGLSCCVSSWQDGGEGQEGREQRSGTESVPDTKHLGCPVES